MKPKRQRILEAASLLYIFLPCLIFLLGWLRPVIAIPAFIIVAFGLYRTLESYFSGEEGFSENASETSRLGKPLNYLLIAGMVIFVILISGIGGFARQIDADFVKHNAFLRDLSEYPWPLAYAQSGDDGAPRAFAAYMGFYLIPALVGKCLGWEAANAAELLWAILGLYLAVLWFLRIVGKLSPLYALLFLAYGGLDIIGFIILRRQPYETLAHSTLDYWLPYFVWQEPPSGGIMKGVFWAYGANICYLYNAFHHVLPGWIIVLMIVCSGVRERSSARVLFLFAATPISSVFVAFGLAPYVLLTLIETRGKNLWTFQNMVAAPLLLFLTILYISSNRGLLEHGWLWEYQDLRVTWPILLLFYVVEFGIYVAACPMTWGTSRPGLTRWWWWTAIACLLLLPLYRLGPFCELTAKGSIPSLIVFQVGIATALHRARTDTQRQAARWLVFLLILGSCSAAQWTSMQLRAPVNLRPVPSRPADHLNNLASKDLYVQFLTSTQGSFFWKHLARPVEYQQDLGNRVPDNGTS